MMSAIERCRTAALAGHLEQCDACERAFVEVRESPPVPAIETGDLAMLRGLLPESDMLTAISAHQLRYEIQYRSLLVLGFPLEQTRRNIGMTLSSKNVSLAE